MLYRVSIRFLQRSRPAPQRRNRPRGAPRLNPLPSAEPSGTRLGRDERLGEVSIRFLQRSRPALVSNSHPLVAESQSASFSGAVRHTRRTRCGRGSRSQSASFSGAVRHLLAEFLPPPPSQSASFSGAVRHEAKAENWCWRALSQSASFSGAVRHSPPRRYLAPNDFHPPVSMGRRACQADSGPLRRCRGRHKRTFPQSKQWIAKFSTERFSSFGVCWPWSYHCLNHRHARRPPLSAGSRAGTGTRPRPAHD